MKKPLKSPFPYPGGKNRVADLVWSRLGNPKNYIEPFAGSLAVLLRRPEEHFAGSYRVETVNDASHFIANFWRAVKHSPDAVADWADNPVMETDLHARHKWLIRSETAAEFRRQMTENPDYYDAKIAGWWVWGQCCWIGGGWCTDNPAHASPDCQGRPNPRPGGEGGIQSTGQKMPKVNSRGGFAGGVAGQPPQANGRIRSNHKAMPKLDNAGGGHGINAGRPQLADAFDIGRGVNGGAAEHKKRPAFPDRGVGFGVNGVNSGSTLVGKRPTLVAGNGTGSAGYITANPNYEGGCSARREWLIGWMNALADRLREVRTLYGDWERPCGSDSTLTRLGTTGVFLDPPYPEKSVCGKKSRDPSLYATDRNGGLNELRDRVLAWCETWGDDPLIRVAVCGYEGDGYERLIGRGWAEVAWEASGGYSNQRRKGRGKSENATRERIWFSPACDRPADAVGLFDAVESQTVTGEQLKESQ